VKEPDQTVTWRPVIADDLPDRLWAYEGSADVDDRASIEPVKGLVSLGYIGAALRRGVRLWATIAVIGFLLGSGYYVAFPPKQKATDSVLLVDNPSENPADEVQTDMALASSIPVASAVIHQLGLSQTPTSFLGTYTVTEKTDQVLTITAGAATSHEAVQWVSAIATQFLKFRSQYAETQQTQTETQLDQQVSQAQQHLDAITKKISQVSSETSTPAQQAELSSLQAQRTAASNALSQVQTYVSQTLASERTVTQEIVNGSEVLNEALPVKASSAKGALLYAVGGLVGGLAVGMAIVIIGAITTDRLRRRDDIAHAFGAPVRLSVGPLSKSRLPDLPRRAAVRRRDEERLVEYLLNAVPRGSSKPVGLAVVAVDDAASVARSAVALAVSSANQRKRVVLADLSAGAHAARLLGVDKPGSTAVSPEGVRIMVAVPAADDVTPVGPLRRRGPTEKYPPDGESLAAISAEADLVVSLVTLDPAFGAEHLSSWATDVVAVITAGRSTAVRVNAAGEMIRLAGVNLCSVVVIGADKGDESLGVASTPYQPAPL
jgi:capsular polysaccharide biosynthesis protein